ncbi:hypothetical protein HDU99_005386 [Rhizoclosmatium hyalinum]|nr:hypothetical protein HDU99_005386 [Rhizoclosmatium hyalinum]
MSTPRRPLPPTPPFLLLLPYELLLQIASHLKNPQHLARFSASNKRLRPLYFDGTLWSALTPPSTDLLVAPPDPIALYKMLSSTVLAPSLSVAWGSDESYWKLSERVDGVTTVHDALNVHVSRRVYALIAVSWFDVIGDIPNVRVGSLYTPTLTLFVRRPFRSLEQIVVSAEVVDADGNTEILPSRTPNKVSMQLSSLIASNSRASFPWIVVSLPKIWVGPEYARSLDGLKTVRIRMEDHSGTWKTGLVIDSFQLVKFVEDPVRQSIGQQESVLGTLAGGVASVSKSANSIFKGFFR